MDRQEKGLLIAALSRILRQENGNWIVPSQSGNGTYVVNASQTTCTCPDFEEGNKCKHLYAVEFTNKRESGQGVPLGETETMNLKKKRKTYKQDWVNYNKAQTQEKHRLQVLLYDLCRWVEPFPRSEKGGRNPVLASDAAFAATFKVYSTVSTRRFACDLRDAQAKGYISQSLHPNSVCRYLEDERLTPRLHALIAVSCRPLRLLETTIAADSTGFSSARYRRWQDEKGRIRAGHDWVKTHIMCGVKTNIVTAVIIKNQKANDSPQFKPLLRATLETFESVDQVLADKGYSSAKNIEAVFYAKAIPYIAFKANATGGIGGQFEKSFDYFI